MKTYRMRLAAWLMMSFLSLVVMAARATPSSAADARSPEGTSPELTVALTHTTYLPLMLSCYPRKGPDPSFIYQYDMSIIHADAAWGLCNLSASGVTIAIIDTGVDLDHPDLQANLLPGYDFVQGDSTPQDGEGHGTNVAGIAAAALNGIGVAGVAPTAKILPVRVLDNEGSGSLSDIANGIIYAADRAQVLNLSLGGPTDSTTIKNAIDYAANTKGRLVVAAAGNCGDEYYEFNGCDSQNQPLYPAAYSNVLAVAATTAADEHASFSNVNNYVDVAAPGVSILNTYPDNAYYAESGTSQAAPHVAGLAALVWAKYPGYTATQVRNRITATAIDLGTAGVDTQFGAGRIDVKQALGLTALQANLPEVNQVETAPSVIADHRTAAIAPGRIIIKFKNSIRMAAVAKTLAVLPQVKLSKSIPAIHAQVLSVPAGAEWTLIDQLRARPEVEYAEPDYVWHMLR